LEVHITWLPGKLQLSSALFFADHECRGMQKELIKSTCFMEMCGEIL